MFNLIPFTSTWGKPLTMNNIKEFGFFREFRSHYASVPGIISFLCDTPQHNQSQIVEYLKNGIAYITVPGTVRDALSEDKKIIGPAHFFTDGNWIWPYELAYLVERYNVIIDSEFAQHMESLGWKVPLENEIDLMEVERLHFKTSECSLE